MTLAHQYRGQLPPEIRAGVDANARNKILFGLNGTDAKEIAHFAPELEPDDFMMLPRYQVYANIMQNRRATGWIQGVTKAPAPPLRIAAESKAESMKRYGRPAEEVDEQYIKMLDEISQDTEPEITEEPIDPGTKFGRRPV